MIIKLKQPILIQVPKNENIFENKLNYPRITLLIGLFS